MADSLSNGTAAARTQTSTVTLGQPIEQTAELSSQLQLLANSAQTQGYNTFLTANDRLTHEYWSKASLFQWRNLLDPEFYPEITIRRIVFFFIWAIPHIIICSYYCSDTKRALIKRINLISMRCILFDVGAILVFMSPTFLMLLRRTFLPRFITFEKNIHAHKVAAYTLLFWAAIHIAIYYDRYIEAAKPKIKKGKAIPGVPLYHNLFEKKTGWTGHILLFSFFVLSIMSIRRIRRCSFEVFYYTHHLFIIGIVFLFIHHDNSVTYKFLSSPLALYCIDRLYRNLRSTFAKSSIRTVVQHPSGVVEIQIDKRILNFRPGQYVKVCCPSVSLLQWHPMTISSAPEEDLLGIHFRLEGDWTRRLAERLGCDFGADARSSSVQNVISQAPGIDAFKFSKAGFSARDNAHSSSQVLDIPYHPLHQDPTTITMYSQIGGNNSYVSIDMAINGGSAAAHNNTALAEDAKSITRVTVKDKAAAKGINPLSLSELEDGNVVIKMGGELPVIFVDGPYSAPAEHFFEYEIGVLIAAGIGVTPAAAVLRSFYLQWLQNRSAMTTKKVYLFWVYRDIGTIEWFKDLIIALKEEGLESIVEICTYFTGRIPETRIPQLTPAEDKFGDQVIGTSIGTKSYIGRPDFSDIFESLGERHPGACIGTFFCGPKPMARKVRREAHKWDKILNKQHNTKLDFYAESFT